MIENRALGVGPGKSQPDALSLDEIRRHLTTARVGRQTYLFGEVGSTNDVLGRLAETGCADGTVLFAEAQTRGRGRLGKSWFSPAGLGFYGSVLFRPALQPAAVPVFSLIASLAVTDAIGATGQPATVRWPNDVVIRGRKVGGVLSGYATQGDVVAHVILGVGVNLNIDRATLEVGLGPAAAAAISLHEAVGRVIDRNLFAARFLNALERWDDVYRARGAEAVLRTWAERDALSGRGVEVRGEGPTYRGVARGLSRAGHLLVEEASGRCREVMSGEVVLVPGLDAIPASRRS